MTTQWHIIELLEGGWAVRRNGVLQLRSVLVQRAWAYVAEHVADDDQVQTQYHNGRSGPMMTGAEMREMVERV
jgi:hypothetical protein